VKPDFHNINTQEALSLMDILPVFISDPQSLEDLAEI